ncbi:hypothetical protein V2J09_013563, partial [Rumex salicifolius]
EIRYSAGDLAAPIDETLEAGLLRSPIDHQLEAKGAIVRLFASSSPAKRKSAICQGGRRLRFLPEAFGKIRGLVVLNLSNNQLQVHTLLKGLEKIAASADIPMLVCGDFNSTPGRLDVFLLQQTLLALK